MHFRLPPETVIIFKDDWIKGETLPELPEVETIRRQLEPAVSGKRIVRARVLDPLLTSPDRPASLMRALSGRGISGLSRRGKYLLIELSDGDVLVIHLRMTGILTLTGKPLSDDEKKYLRFVVELDNGMLLAFNDSRRFGKAFILASDEIDDYWRKMGPEPLERSFDRKTLAALLEGRKRPIKPALLDQRLVAGIGNIYADEALFAAKIHPERPSGAISGKEIEVLVKSIKETLRRAIKLQGSSIDSYRDALGNRGSFQNTFKVHRRAGEPCPRCGTAIEKIKVGGRGTYFCPYCQKKK